MALKRTGFEGRIVGVSSAQTIGQAVETGAIDDGFTYDHLETALSCADLVFLCTPISRILDLIEPVASAVPKGAVITDVGSTKTEIVRTAQRVVPEGVHFIGGHPMAGSEKRGVLAADPYLFENAIYVLAPARGVPETLLDCLSGLVSRLGAKVVLMEPEEHDRTAAAISHLPQMVAISLVSLVGHLDGEESMYLRLAAGGFRDMTRIASSPYDVWRDICRTNVEEVEGMIDAFVRELSSVRDHLRDARLGDDFAFANRIRGAIPRDAKGFIHPLYDVVLVAQDRPGVIAEIALALADAGININDIEVLKVREGEAGTIRLAFENEVAADKAVAILACLGYRARPR